MLVWFSDYLMQFNSDFGVLQYITVRGIFSVLTALFVSLIIGPYLIDKLQYHQIGQVVRDDGPETHFSKAGTPTMGGALILVSIAISTLLWSNLNNHYVWVLLSVTLLFGGIGWVDDYRKVFDGNSAGLSAKWKYFWQSLIGLAAALILYSTASSPIETSYIVPFFKDVIIDFGSFYVVISYFVIVGFSNAVNLTDGLDGLATVPVILVAGCFAFISYVSGNIVFSDYLQITYIEGTGEISIFCGAIIGACLGFLWFNAPPAKIFMGDTGSLSLGGSLGAVGIITKHEIVLAITGGLFVLEALSVMVQVISFKLTGKRIFKMAPIHHHFEKKGWPESTVVVRFWIISIILAMIGLATLKLR